MCRKSLADVKESNNSVLFWSGSIQLYMVLNDFTDERFHLYFFTLLLAACLFAVRSVLVITCLVVSFS